MRKITARVKVPGASRSALPSPTNASRTTAPAREGVVRNMSWLTAGNVLVKPLWLVFITAICMRGLGVEGYGVLTATLGLATMFGSASNIGTSLYLTREVARTPERASALFTNLLVGRLLLISLVIGLTLWVGQALGYARPAMTTLFFAALFASGAQILELCRALYRAFEVLRYEAVSVVTERLMVIGFGTMLLLSAPAPATAVGGMALGMGLALTANLWWVHHRLAPVGRRVISHRLLLAAYRTALPLGLFSLFADLYVRSGPVLLERLVSAQAAGVYGAASRLIEAALLLPTMVAAVLLPRLSALRHLGEAAAYRRLLFRGLFGVGLAAVVVAAVGTLLGPWILHLLDPNPAFAQSGPLFQVLVWSFPLMVINFLLSTALFVGDQQRYLAVVCGLAVVVSLGLSLVMIPVMGTYGAVFALLGTEAFVLAGFALRYRPALAFPTK